jgi:hypothetical protein
LERFLKEKFRQCFRGIHRHERNKNDRGKRIAKYVILEMSDSGGRYWQNLNLF